MAVIVGTLLRLLSQTELENIIATAVIVVAVVAVLAAANAGERSDAWRVVAYVLVAFIAGLVVVSGALLLLSAPRTSRLLAGSLVQVAGGVVGGAALVPAVRRLVVRLIPTFDAGSCVHAVSLSLYAIVLLGLISQQVAVDQLKAIAASGESPSLCCAIVAATATDADPLCFAGVGLFVRRNLRDTVIRLGLVWPGWRWIAASAGVAVLLVVFGLLFDSLTARLTPEQSKSIQDVSSQLLKNVRGLPAVIILGVAAGVGEEILFRGALLPKLGNPLAALLFAALHTQYAVSLASLEILVLGMVLGLLRRRAGTTGCIVAHAGYDIIVGVLTLAP